MASSPAAVTPAFQGRDRLPPSFPDGIAQKEVIARLFDAEDPCIGGVRWREGDALD